jgi:arylsulfatase A-like enzyme
VWIIVTLLMIAVSACGAAPGPPPEPVNLVIVSIDTLRPDHLGVYGYPHPTSPNLDRFAQRSIVFDQAVTVHVATAPAHGTILTGRYPGSHGIQRNGMRLSPDVPTLAETLARHGLATGAFVSGWTLQRHTGLDRGFDVYDDTLDAPGAGARRAGGLTTQAALGWLQRQVTAKREFFLFLHLFEPHWPYDPPAQDALRFLPGQYELTTISKPVHIDRRNSVNRLTPFEQREYVARYDGEIVAADRFLDRLLNGLDDLGVANNTVVIVLADHGETLFEREWTMDHGTRPYDEQARVPMVLHIPGDRLTGRRVADQVSLLDVVPTLLDVLEIDPPAGLQGRSLLPLVRGESTATTPLPAFITARSEGKRVSHIRAPLTDRGMVRAIRLPTVKLIEFPMAGGRRYSEVFDLSEDPGEKTNRAKTNTGSVLALRRELQRWQTTSGGDPDPAAPALDPEVEAALRELGYLDD